MQNKIDHVVELEEQIVALINATSGYKKAPTDKDRMILGVLADSYESSYKGCFNKSPAVNPQRQPRRFVKWWRSCYAERCQRAVA